MKRFLGLTGVTVALASLVTAAYAQDGAPACAPYPTGAPTYTCACPALSPGDGPIWGSDPYTSDSDICTAALHAGIIDYADGGVVVAYSGGLRQSFPASDENGTLSLEWTTPYESFTFSSDDDVAMTVPGLLPIQDSLLADCAAFPPKADSYSCYCSAQATAKGTVWGNDPYSSDSNICRAALHSGLVTEQGGDVTALRVIGLEYYSAVFFNGVQSEQSGFFDSSFVFNRN